MLALLLMFAAANPAQTDMLAQFQAGKLLCSNPDVVAKTCSTIDRLIVRSDGVMINIGETLIAPGQPITLEVASEADFEAGAMCGVMSEPDIKKGIVRANGTPIPADRNAAVVQKVIQLSGALIGQRVCEGLRMNGDQLVKVGQVQSLDMPIGKPVRWIRPDEGYRVAPHSP